MEFVPGCFDSFCSCLLFPASQASATPLRIYVLGHEGSSSAVVAGKDGQPEQLDAAVAPLRWGHAAAGAQHQEPKPMVVYTHTESPLHEDEGEEGEMEGTEEHDFHLKGEEHHFRMKGKGPKGRRPKFMGMGCGRGSMRAKAFALQNWLRSKFGMESIEPFHHHHPDFKSGGHPKWLQPLEASAVDEHGPKHFFPPPPHHPSEMHDGEEHHHPHHLPQFGEMEDGEGRVHHAHHDHHMHHFRRPHSFGGRLTKALMTLGPWEGRAVAFVLGEQLTLDMFGLELTAHYPNRSRHRFPYQDALRHLCPRFPCSSPQQ